MHINFKVSFYLLYISKEYKIRTRYIYLNILLEDSTLYIALLITLSLIKILLQESSLIAF
jgi:hypothetical protein